MTYFKFNRTKIVATLGPACADKATLIDMFKEGMDVARLNFSHATHKIHAESLAMVREINKELGTSVAILQDLQGPKIRIATLKKPVKIETGQVITLRTDTDKEGEGYIPIVYDTFAKDVSPGDMVLIDDGKVELIVTETNGTDRVKLRVEGGEVISSRKGVNLPNTRISIPTLTEKDYRDIDFAIKHNVEWVALSFVRSANDIHVLRELIRLKKGKSRIIAKIEKPEALEDIDNIIAASDGIMVARGDLGVEIPLEDVPMWQKRIVKKSNLAAKPVIVATQVMESMITNKRPTRAEVNDAANAVVDGADALMLSGETSVGKYPSIVVGNLSKIISKIEEQEDAIYYKNMKFTGNERNPLSTAIIHTACNLADSTQAKAIIGMTQSGYTAFQLAHCRPKAFIYIFTNNRQLIHVLNLVWGIRALYYDSFVSTDETIKDIHDILSSKGFVQTGDIIINTASMPLKDRGLTNMVKIAKVK